MNEQDMNKVLSKAEVLIEALPYIQKFNRKYIVVKYGGSAMSNEELQKNVIKDVTLLKLVGFKPDFYVKVELEMFVELVDLVEGVEFDVPQDMNYDDPWQDLHIHLKKRGKTPPPLSSPRRRGKYARRKRKYGCLSAARRTYYGNELTFFNRKR